MSVEYPFKTKALLVQQKIGIFYVAVIPAEVLLDVAYSDTLAATKRAGEDTYDLEGTQRLPQPRRLQPIAEYINRVDAAFPNSIILAANYRKADGLLQDNAPDGEEVEESDDSGTDLSIEIGGEMHDIRWSLAEVETDIYELTIPSKTKLAAIIDGQHRLFAFAKAIPERRSMQLVCSIFLDLPKPFQAQIFATINSTQKPVDKSLTYELFGYNIADESESYWSPDKLAVFFSRKLVAEDKSPLQGRIVIAPRVDSALAKLGSGKNWKVSTAVIVQGIVRLITTNPKRDAAQLLANSVKTRRELKDYRKDKSPLREYYIEGNDVFVYTVVVNYLIACNQVFWSNASGNSFITKTVGVQALFDVLKKIVVDAIDSSDISAAGFLERLKPASELNFSTDEFQNASGSGRSKIRREIEKAIGI